MSGKPSNWHLPVLGTLPRNGPAVGSHLLPRTLWGLQQVAPRICHPSPLAPPAWFETCPTAQGAACHRAPGRRLLAPSPQRSPCRCPEPPQVLHPLKILNLRVLPHRANPLQRAGNRPTRVSFKRRDSIRHAPCRPNLI